MVGQFALSLDVGGDGELALRQELLIEVPVIHQIFDVVVQIFHGQLGRGQELGSTQVEVQHVVLEHPRRGRDLGVGTAANPDDVRLLD